MSRDSATDQHVGSCTNQCSVRRVERLQNEINRSAIRSNTRGGGDYTCGVGTDVDRTGSRICDTSESDFGSTIACASIERDSTSDTSHWRKGQS